MKQLFLFIALILAHWCANGQWTNNNFSATDRSKLNSYLTDIYSSSTSYFDTLNLNFRDECYLLAKSEDPTEKLNGLITLGILDLYGKQIDSSIFYFKSALRLDSNCYPCYLKLHWINFYLKQNYQEANKLAKSGIARFEKNLSIDSTGSESWSKLFNMYDLNETRQREKSKQRISYIAKKRVMLDSTNAYYQWEYSFYCPTSEKEYHLLNAFELNPSEDIYWNALANYYCEKKDLRKVVQIMNDVKPLENDSAYWFQQMAHYYYKLGKKTEALAISGEAKKHGHTIVYKW